MLDRPWEIEAPSLAITIAWGDVALHTAHLSPPRPFFLGDSTADCVLPDTAIGPGRVPLILAHQGAIYLVLHAAMDPDGTVTLPGQRPRTVADLARPGMGRTSLDAPDGFLIELRPGTTAALSFGAITIAITLETKAAVAVAGHFHTSRRMVPFQIGSTALHLAVLGLAALFMPPLPEDLNDVSSDRMYFIQQALERIDEKEMEAMASDADDPDAWRYEQQQSTYHQPYRGAGFSTFDVSTYGDEGGRSETPADPARVRLSEQLGANERIAEDGVNSAIDPHDDRRSALAVDVDTAAYGMTRRTLLRGEAPALVSVRPEAFLNSFDYGYDGPARGATTPFAVHLDAAPSPFEAGHHLLRVGVQAMRSADGEPALVARDVRIEARWNADAVTTYRLLGYENRARRGDYRRDDGTNGRKVAAGHSVTAVYDVVLATTALSPVTVRLDSRTPGSAPHHDSTDFVMSTRAIAPTFAGAPRSLRLAVAVVGFAEILRKNPYALGWHLADVERVALGAIGDGDQGQELMSLIHAARSLDEPQPTRAWGGRVADASLLGF
ncbi:MAG: von Willebrand factor type A domain-containing protein [Byssovorax sp.]